MSQRYFTWDSSDLRCQRSGETAFYGSRFAIRTTTRGTGSKSAFKGFERIGKRTDGINGAKSTANRILLERKWPECIENQGWKVPNQLIRIRSAVPNPPSSSRKPLATAMVAGVLFWCILKTWKMESYLFGLPFVCRKRCALLLPPFSVNLK